jgi:hypothetical protein
VTGTPDGGAARARGIGGAHPGPGADAGPSSSTSSSAWAAAQAELAAAAQDRQSVQSNPGYKQWIAQPGTLIASLLECAGASHVVTMDLHTSVYQGFFDVPVDNLYGKALLKDYIQTRIKSYQQAVIVSPDAGGAKRATDLADSLNMDFALIHKVGGGRENDGWRPRGWAVWESGMERKGGQTRRLTSRHVPSRRLISRRIPPRRLTSPR